MTQKLANLSIPVAALLLFSACGGDGGGDSLPTPTATPSFAGREAVQVGAGVASSLALLVELVVGDAGLGGNPLDLRAIQTGECELGGQVEAGCRHSGDGSLVSAEFSNCEIGLPDRYRLILDGRAEIRFPVAHCELAQLPAGVPRVARLSGLRATVVDQDNNQHLQETVFDLEQALTPTALGCGGEDGRLTLGGRIELIRPASATALTFEISGLALDLGTLGDASRCRRTAVISGDVAVSHRNPGRSFAVKFEQTLTSIEAFGLLGSAVTIDGELFTDCAGGLQLETISPITHNRFEDCAVFGEMILSTGAAHSQGRVRYTDHGGIGFDFDLDGNYESGGESCNELPPCWSPAAAEEE